MTPPKNQNSEPAPDERPAESVASPAENAKLEHSDGGTTTRSDLHDAGVPMTQGESGTTAPVGPEDALGAEPTRGDYSDRTVSGPSLTSVPLTDEERKAYRDAADKGQVAEVPRSKLVEQRPATPAA